MPADRPSRGDIERRAIETYGEPMQMVVCMEECAELIGAICEKALTIPSMSFSAMREFENYAQLIKNTCKFWRSNKTIKNSLPQYGEWEHIREEVADVQIMLDQMKMIFGPTLIVEDAKLKRLAGNMGLIIPVGESR